MRDGELSSLVATPGATDQGITVADTAIALGDLTAEATTHVLVTVSDQPIRVTFDGSDPTTSNGHYWAAAKEEVLTRELAAVMKMIRATGSSGYLHATELTY